MSEPVPVRPPIVARRAAARRSIVPAALAATALGALVFVGLGANRTAHAARETTLPPLAAPSSAEPAPLVLPANYLAPPAPPPAPAPRAVVAPPPTPAPALFATPIRPVPRAIDTGAAERERARLRAPTLIVDLAARGSDAPAAAADTPPVQLASLSLATPPGAAASAVVGASFAPTDPVPVQLAQAGPADPTGATAAAVAAGAAAAGATPAPRLNGNESFAARVGGQEVESAQATRLAHLDRLIPQGAIIAAVLETALDSDLPGYARAIVNRDVLSFDGSAVLIPAGSRVIGQYNSGVAQGASRVFIVWQRLIRPDGVSIALASPATDDLGRGGLAGRVNRHFLQRYGGAILLSVLTGGISAGASALSSGSTVIVGTANEATGLASQASNSLNIPPTIRTPQGANVRIFVARDLDFTGVGPAA